MSISVVLKDAQGNVLQRETAEQTVHMAVERTYAPGDCLEVTGAEHLIVQMDQTLTEGEVYAPKKCMTYRIPFGPERSAYPPYAFEGEKHVVRVREMTDDEIRAHRPISRNPHDLRGDTDYYPHATANVETRGEADFAARNIIDGVYTNRGHGPWPYGSWGIGTRQDAALTVDFGREVQIDSVRVLLRADFPHDSWWESCVFVFSDGTQETMHLVKSDAFQTLPVRKTISWIRLEQMKKADDPSPFPSIRQLEVIGCDLL
ncbi:MAG: carbohydrate-binding protein [Clostridia bacterium]|nr:carbohydrate-binding protein [Clostridia bacterium]